MCLCVTGSTFFITCINFLTPTVLPNGSVVGTSPTSCVSQRLLEEIDSWKRAGASSQDVVDRLQLRCVPSGYTPLPWSAGTG